jgi:elongation factor Ts
MTRLLLCPPDWHHCQVRRFVKFNLGEGLEKRSNDFAAEVAQQTQAKAKPAADAKPAAAAKEQPKQPVGCL